MLPLYSQFLIRFAIRNPLYLLNPKIIKQEDVILPKDAVLHYLDTTNDNLFPSRELSYIKDLPKNKKIPIYHIDNLAKLDGTVTLKNKYLPQDIRKWNMKNIREFKYVNLLEVPNVDASLISIFNYNTVKDLYRYSTSLLSEYNQYYNLYYTYYSTVKKAASISNVSKHFVRIDLPSLIPSYFLIDKFIEFNAIKYSRVIKDHKLKQVVDLYMWLTDKTRNKSTLKDITDEDCNKVVIEICYKGYSCFLPLEVIRSICEESKLESKLKLKPNKVNRIFILSLLKIQGQVDTIIDGIEKDLEKAIKDTNTDTIGKDIEEEVSSELQEESTNDDEMDNSEDRTSETKDLVVYGATKKLKDINIDINELSEFDENSLSNLLDSKLEDITNKEADDIYLDITNKDDSEKETADEVEDTSINFNFTDEHKELILTDKTKEEQFNEHVSKLIDLKLVSSAEIRSIKKVYANRLELKSPYNPSKLINDDVSINKEDLIFTKESKIVDIQNNLVSDDLKNDPIKSYDEQYVNTLIKKDVLACVTNLEKANIFIKNYEIEEEKTALGNYEIHKLSLYPLNGKDSTVYFRLPKIDNEGEFVVSGIKVRMRKQRADLPIRKISYNKVSLTSNYCKLFINRSERKAYDYFEYIVDYIKESYLNEEGIITALTPGNNFNSYAKLPNMYMYLSKYFNLIETKEYTLTFKYNTIIDHIDEKIHQEILSKNLVFAGYTKDKKVIVIDHDDKFSIYRTNELVPIGTIEDIINIDSVKIPVTFSTIKILGKDIPLGTVMGYYIGLTNLISITKANVQILESGKQYKVNNNEFILKFNDYKVVVDKTNKEAALLLSGFLFFKDFIKQYNFNDFNNKGVYLGLIEERDFNILHIKELDLLRDLFLDPITISVLKEINEPTEYLKLLLRANQLLTDFSHPEINDTKFARIRGYDRVPGLMYKALVESVRDYKFKHSSKNKIELDPYKVWNIVTQDNTVKIVEDINPVMDIKEMESVTITGLDGLDKDAIPHKLRKYSKEDLGLISEATAVGPIVGVNTLLTPYAKLSNLRGMVDSSNTDHIDNPSKIFSTSSMLAPMIEHDDPKRIFKCPLYK